MYDSPNQKVAKYKNRNDQVVKVKVVFKINEPKKRPARHALQAVFAAGELGLQKKEIDHLRERQSDHRKIDATAPNRQGTHRKPQDASHRNAIENPELSRNAPDLHCMTGSVSGGAQKGGMTKREQTSETKQ